MNRDMFSKQVKVVLMRTTHPGNVGAVARAMKNMGLSDLSLVSPEFNKVLSEHEALRRSSGAEDVLSGAKVFDNLDEAVADCHILVGASARNRKMPWPLMNPNDCAKEMMQQIQKKSGDDAHKVAFLFGQEASGLSNEELQRCHYHVNIPAVAEFSSLNLAMAVQVICYELRMAYLDVANDKNEVSAAPLLSPASEGWDEPLASVKEVEGFLKHLETTLIKTEFHDPKNPRLLMTRLRRLFQRTHLDQMEVNILRGVLTSINKMIK